MELSGTTIMGEYYAIIQSFCYWYTYVLCIVKIGTGQV